MQATTLSRIFKTAKKKYIYFPRERPNFIFIKRNMQAA